MATCPVQCALKYVYGFKVNKISLPVEAGNAFHRALELHFKGSDDIKCETAFNACYLPYWQAAMAGGVSDSKEKIYNPKNLRKILRAYLDTHAVDRYPFNVEGTEVSVMTKLTEDIDFHALIDVFGVEKIMGVGMVMDHKTTAQRILGVWWTKQFGMSSQMLGYIYAAKEGFDIDVAGIYLNAIKMMVVPGSNRRCSVHGVKYEECGHLHCEFSMETILIRQKMIDEWFKEAVMLGEKYKELVEYLNKDLENDADFTGIEKIAELGKRGTWNKGCTFCDWWGFCNGGRQRGYLNSLEVEKWRPWL
jgi:hypothetical protein